MKSAAKEMCIRDRRNPDYAGKQLFHSGLYGYGLVYDPGAVSYTHLAAYADYDIWNNDDCFLCALQYCRQHFGIPLCAENL